MGYFDICVEELPGCCGVEVISNFPQTEDELIAGADEYDVPNSETEFRPSTHKEAIAQLLTDGGFDDLDTHCPTLATLNEDQVELGIEKVLLKNRFQKIYSFRNPETKNMVHLYLAKPKVSRK